MKFSPAFGCVSNINLTEDILKFKTGTVTFAEGSIEIDDVKYFITKCVGMNFPSQSCLSLYLPSYLTDEKSRQ